MVQDNHLENSSVCCEGNTIRTNCEPTLRSKMNSQVEISIHYSGSTASSVNEEVPQTFQRTDL